MWKAFLFSILVVSSNHCFAEASNDVELFRRVVVFPVLGTTDVRKSSEEAWWQIRELLTEHRRFLVASKNFLKSKGVFQPRGELSPADAVILGRLLDAHILITTFINNKKVHMRVYEGKAGRLVWKGSVLTQTSVPRGEQVVPISVNLVRSFVQALPYQGFVLKDDIANRALYDRTDRTYFKVYTGINSGIEFGDKVQLIRIQSESTRAILTTSNQEVFAEGKVVRVMDDRVEVELLRATSLADVRENSLARFPKVLAQVKNSLESVGDLKNLGPEYYKSGERELTKEEKERKPLVTALAFVTNIIAMLLIAF